MFLVTGATGFIGSHLVETLCARGEQVRCLIRRKTRPATLPSAVETVRVDLAGGEGLSEALRGVTSVIHLAGVTKALTPADYYDGNYNATENLARAAANAPARFVHVSSLAAVGPGGSATPLTEDAEPHPLTHYGKSKLEAEHALRKWRPDAVIIRPPVVYGPRDTDVLQLLRSIARGLVLEISGGDRWFSAIYVDDLVAGILAAARHSAAAGRTYFLAHPKPLSWAGFGAEAARIMGRRPRTLRIPVPLAHLAGYCGELWSRRTRKPVIVSREKILEAKCAYWICDPSRAAAELGFQAGTPIEEGLARTLAWYKEAGWLIY